MYNGYMNQILPAISLHYATVFMTITVARCVMFAFLKISSIIKVESWACTYHVERILGNFDPPFPLWTLLLKSCY